MIHRHRGNRRLARAKKIERRKRLLEELGTKGGTLYEKHVEKVEKSGGYMAKHGTYGHYGQLSHYGEKTRDNDRYGKNESWKHSDQQKLDSMSDGIREYNMN